jgi:hypothetical protein
MAKLQESLMESEERERDLEAQVREGEGPGIPGMTGVCGGSFL